MKKITILFLLILGYQNLINAQTCKNNLLTNPSFSQGLSNGWSEFHSSTAEIMQSGGSCLDSFILLGFYAGIVQSVPFANGRCYNLCLCLSDEKHSSVKIFAATSDTGVTLTSLLAYSYPAGTAQLIDSINVNSPGKTFCKNNWTATANYTRLIIINDQQWNGNGGEVVIDNVCLSPCENPCDSLSASFTYTKSGLNANFTNTSSFPGGSLTGGYQWDFGDATTSILANPGHTYASANNYSVCLITTGMKQNQTCNDTTCKIVSVTASGFASTFFEGLKIIAGSEKLTVSFDNQNFDCEILEMTGKSVKQFKNVSNVEVYNNTLNHGIYVVRVSKDGVTYSQRVVF